MPRAYQPRQVKLRDGREVTLRAVAESDAAEIVQGFERLSIGARYSRLMQHRKELDPATLERAVRPQPGSEFAVVAAIPAGDGIDLVGAGRYVSADGTSSKMCEFGITVADDWRGSGLGTEMLAALVQQAQRDGYTTMEGWVLAENAPMLALARKLEFTVEPVPEDGTVLRVERAL